jgi:D-alanyl-D-alanine carboxypeptidase
MTLVMPEATLGKQLIGARREVKLIAKTAALSPVSALAGYLDHLRRLAAAVLVNNT